MLNKVQIIGSLGKDPELKTSQSGSSYANVSVATSERVKKGEEWADHTEWHRVTVFGRQAENLVKFCKKGKRIYVEGKLRTSKYVDDNGVEKFSTAILADDVKFLSAAEKKDQSEDNHGSNATDEDVPF